MWKALIVGSVAVVAAHELADEVNEYNDDHEASGTTLSDMFPVRRAFGFEKIKDTSRFEFYVVLALVASLGVLVWGRIQNKKIATHWLASLSESLYQNFSRVGRTKEGLTLESYNHYSLYASGRQNILGSTFNVVLRARQDFLNFAQGYMFGQEDDKMIIEAFLPKSAPHGVIFVARSKDHETLSESQNDVKTLCKKQSSSPIAGTTFYRDSFDQTGKIPLQAFGKVLNDCGLGEHLISIHISDQATLFSPGGPAVVPSDSTNPAAASTFTKKKFEEIANEPVEETSRRQLELKLQTPYVGLRNGKEISIAGPTEIVRTARLTLKLPTYSLQDERWGALGDVTDAFLALVDAYVTLPECNEKTLETMAKERVEGFKKQFPEVVEKEAEQKKELEKKREEDKLAKMTPADRKKYLEKKEDKKNKPKQKMVKMH